MTTQPKSVSDPKKASGSELKTTLSRLHKLPATAVNQIAAGEVIERPAAAVKELVENAIDAGADRVQIEIQNGGKTRIRVIDNGVGMSPDDMVLAVERHATSKLQPDDNGVYDLSDIGSFGFRGEALPSIGAVARLLITSRARGLNGPADDAFELSVEGGVKGDPTPARFSGCGASIDISDLFYATPARLKFLKSDQAETSAVAETTRRLAMAHPEVSFSLLSNGRKLFDVRAESVGEEGWLKRVSAVMGKDFEANALAINAKRGDMTLRGFAGLPTFNRGLPDKQFLFVNGRPVRDKLIVGAVRGAYADFLARDRHPAVAMFLELDPRQVDVNVHPAKTEVRFRDAGSVRGLIVGAIRHALAEAGHRASTTTSEFALGRMQAGSAPGVVQGRLGERPVNPFRASVTPMSTEFSGLHDRPDEYEDRVGGALAPGARVETETIADSAEDNKREYPLGAARAQLHETYIVAQTNDGLVIIDQHAAHERLVYEGLKEALHRDGVPRQGLLIPEIVELDQDDVRRLVKRQDQFEELGLVLEQFGDDAVIVRETPALLGRADVQSLVRRLADDLTSFGEGLALKERLEEVASSMACRGSIRSGRRLNGEEMNALLRQMEATPYSGQCNHGRPTYVELKLSDIEKLFGRR